MKSRVVYFLSLLVPFAVIYFYVWSTAADIAFREDMFLIKGGYVEQYCNGTLSFSELWRSAGKIRFLGYNILQVMNIKWLGMNSKIIVLLIPLLMLASALLVYRQYRKSLIFQQSELFTAASFLLLSLLIFNVIQWEGLTFSYGFVFQSAMPFFIASVISMELLLAKSKAIYWFSVFLLSGLSVLVFSGSQVFAFAPALGVTFICYVYTHRDSLTQGFWLRVFLVGVFLATLACLYMYRIHDNDYFPYSSLHAETVLAHPFIALRFLLVAFGASVLGVNAAEMYCSSHFMVFLGACVLFLYGLCGYLFFAHTIYKVTYLPLYLILQAFFFLVFMMIGRFGYGIDYGMASRYTCVSIYGIVGIIWIIIYCLVNSKKINQLNRGLFYIAIAIIYSGVLITFIVEWRIQPYRKAYFQNLREIALRVDTASDDELSKFEERPQLVSQSLKILRDCNLNVYRHSGR